MTDHGCLDRRCWWLTLVVPSSCGLVDAALKAIPPDEDGQPEEIEAIRQYVPGSPAAIGRRNEGR